MGSFRLNNSSVPVPSAFTEVAPATLIGQIGVSFGVLGVPSGTRVYIRANYPGPTAIPDDGSNAEWMLYTRSVMSAHLRYAGDDGATLIVEIGSVESGAVPVVVDTWPFWIPPNNYPFTISGMELPGLVARFAVVFEGPAVNESIAGSVVVRGV